MRLANQDGALLAAYARARIATLGLTDVGFPPLALAPASGDFISEMTKSITMIAQSLDA